MGLSASMYSGISGLQVHGEKMGVIGNNIANVNTIGFKGALMYFEDAISQDIPTSAGIGQVGRGAGISAIYADYSQGSFETTGQSTDCAIAGDGFFVVKKPNTEEQYYTRAGNFRFNNDGYLEDPNGMIVQGWQVQQAGTTTAVGGVVQSNAVQLIGTPTDIRLDNFQSPPMATQTVSIMNNLDSTSQDMSMDAAPPGPYTDPFFTMFNNWDGTAATPIASTLYAHQTTIKVYDDNGGSHDLTVYFDPVTLESDTGGQKVWEYMVTCNPAEDNRTLNGTTLQGDPAAGVLMMGTMTFDSTGTMTGQSAFTLKDAATAPFDDLAEWTPADFSQGGYPVCTANFLGEPGSDATDDTNPRLIEMDFGLRNTDIATGWAAGGVANAAALNTIAPNNNTVTNLLPDFATGQLSALASTSYANAGNSTLFMSQDGYAAGLLQGVEISEDGILSGSYSNGEIIELYCLTLASFNNDYGLRREGGNLFTETRDSGVPITNRPGEAGNGLIYSNSVEQSNVDLSEEMVSMITTQRGFEANGKIITTVDTMLNTVINLKR